MTKKKRVQRPGQAPVPPRAKPTTPASTPPRQSPAARATPLILRPTTQFKRDVKRMKKRNKDIAKLESVIRSLVQGQPLAAHHADHALAGELKGARDCHIEPDWILIYKRDSSEWILFRTGSHADLKL